MAISIKTDKEIASMKIGGKILAETLAATLEIAKPGVTTYELDQFAEKYIIQHGGIPAFKGYHGFPGTLCTALNEVVVHGIPRKDEIIQEGDLLTIDCGVIYDGLYTDAARSMGIGQISDEKNKLIKTAKKALAKGIEAAKPGNKVSQISKVIDQTIKQHGFKVIFDLTGHGVGRTLHEDPIIPNYWDKKNGFVLKPGMTIAIEPIFSTGTHDIVTLDDDWTIVTSDGSCSVQQEETILITPTGNEIITTTR